MISFMKFWKCLISYKDGYIYIYYAYHAYPQIFKLSRLSSYFVILVLSGYFPFFQVSIYHFIILWIYILKSYPKLPSQFKTVIHSTVKLDMTKTMAKSLLKLVRVEKV